MCLVLGIFGAVAAAQEAAPANTTYCWGEFPACDTPCLQQASLRNASVLPAVCAHVQVVGEMASWAMEAPQIHLCPWKYRATTHLWRSALVDIMRAGWTQEVGPGAGVSFLYVTPPACLCQDSMLLSHKSCVCMCRSREIWPAGQWRYHNFSSARGSIGRPQICGDQRWWISCVRRGLWKSDLVLGLVSCM